MNTFKVLGLLLCGAFTESFAFETGVKLSIDSKGVSIVGHELVTKHTWPQNERATLWLGHRSMNRVCGLLNGYVLKNDQSQKIISVSSQAVGGTHL